MDHANPESHTESNMRAVDVGSRVPVLDAYGMDSVRNDRRDVHCISLEGCGRFLHGLLNGRALPLLQRGPQQYNKGG